VPSLNPYGFPWHTGNGKLTLQITRQAIQAPMVHFYTLPFFSFSILRFPTPIVHWVTTKVWEDCLHLVFRSEGEQSLNAFHPPLTVKFSEIIQSEGPMRVTPTDVTNRQPLVWSLGGPFYTISPPEPVPKNEFPYRLPLCNAAFKSLCCLDWYPETFRLVYLLLFGNVLFQFEGDLIFWE